MLTPPPSVVTEATQLTLFGLGERLSDGESLSASDDVLPELLGDGFLEATARGVQVVRRIKDRAFEGLPVFPPGTPEETASTTALDGRGGKHERDGQLG